MADLMHTNTFSRNSANARLVELAVDKKNHPFTFLGIYTISFTEFIQKK